MGYAPKCGNPIGLLHASKAPPTADILSMLIVINALQPLSASRRNFGTDVEIMLSALVVWVSLRLFAESHAARKAPRNSTPTFVTHTPQEPQTA